MRKMFFLFFVFVSVSTLNAQSLKDRRLEPLRLYAESFLPTYRDRNGASVKIARIGAIPDSLNEYLQYCIEHRIEASYKYSFLIIMKLASEFFRVNSNDYDLCYYLDDRIVRIAFLAMDRSYTDETCFAYKTYDIYLWLKEHKCMYEGYKPLKDAMNKLKKDIKARNKRFRSLDE